MDAEHRQRWWIRSRFRDNVVYALCDDVGSWVAVEGLVPIRYRPAGKEYRTRPDRLQSVDGAAPETLPEVAPTPQPGRPTGTSPAPSTGAWRSETEVVQLWTDGACSGNPGPAGAGVHRRFRGKVEEISEYLGEGTNNVAELTAILLGLRTVEDPRQSIDVITDSTYCIGLLTQGWKAKANQALVAELRAEMTRHRDVRMVKVKGHAGVEGNERADTLAVDAITRAHSGTEQS